jgi:hypothetical protein
MSFALIAVMTTAAFGCGADPFPPESEPGWIEARTPACVLSHDHDLTFIRVWTDEGAHQPYVQQAGVYPVGARLLKGLYRDEDCLDLTGWVTMEKLAEGSAPELYDWDWQRFRADGSVLDDPRRVPYGCVDCHVWHCEEPPYGNDLTCNPNGPEPIGPRP